MNTITKCDCLAGMAALPPESVDLVYLDPPFFTGRSHAGTSKTGHKRYAFDDVWPGREEYAAFIHERIMQVSRVLKPTGSVFFHCDHNASHIIRSILDEVFGPDNFRSEVVWSYKRWSNTKKGLLQRHQNILFYSKSDSFKWIGKRVDYSATTNVDQILQQRERDWRGKAIYKRDLAGDVIASEEKKGVPLGDVWEIPFLNPKAKERTGYPTQKPLQLLDQIIELVTEEGDVVLDPFAGSGTTLVSAAMANRNYIGFDISQDAVALTEQRLKNPIRSESLLLKKGIASYVASDPWVDAHLVGFDFDRVHRNSGIDAILRTKLNGKLVCVRVQRAGESMVEALSAGQAAMKIRPGCVLALVQTVDGFFDLTGPGLTVLVSPALQMRRLSDGHAAERLPHQNVGSNI